MVRPSHLILAALLPVAAVLPVTAPAQDATLVLPPDADGDLRDILEAASLTLSLESEGLTASQDYVAAARADYRRLLAGLYSEGYYGGVISILVDGQEASSIQPLDAPGTIRQVTLNVAPGPRFTFGTAAIAPLAPATDLPLDFAPGEVARSLTVEAAVAAALTAWREEGNAKAQVASEQITAVHPGDRLDVAIGIAPGPELTFGPVTVSGNENVRTQRILRIAGVPTGRVFAPEDLERAATRLRRTGAFESVAVVESDAIGPGDTLPIELQVVESLPRRIGFGAEISSLDGLSANAFWLHRNLLGGAESLRIEGEVSDIGSDAIGTASGGTDYALGVTFNRPATFSPDNDLTVAAEVSQEDQEDYFLQQLTFDVGITRYATDSLTLTFALGVLAAHEETPIATRDYALLTAPLSAVWDRRDDDRDPRGGFYIDAEATPFLTISGDTGNGARLYADARLYRSFGTRVTLAARGQLGSVLGADRDEVPQDYLFLAGGSDTVRGVPFESLGVEVPDPEAPGETVTLGGTSLAGLQVEGRVGITESIGAVAFADAAYVGEEAFPFSDGDWAAGVGIGARYDTFVGPIRLDIATPATGDDAFGQVQVYIGIGQAF
ncbi:MAG TPA: BamA/TamA family outer membrane protein [Rubellimicrobium sp.]|nr:BamA/TamA family outer membrane protein [Rubellimicrobium sp.]